MTDKQSQQTRWLKCCIVTCIQQIGLINTNNLSISLCDAKHTSFVSVKDAGALTDGDDVVITDVVVSNSNAEGGSSLLSLLVQRVRVHTPASKRAMHGFIRVSLRMRMLAFFFGLLICRPLVTRATSFSSIQLAADEPETETLLSSQLRCN